MGACRAIKSGKFASLRGLPGVADVNVLGGRAKTFEVSPDPAALAATGLTAQAIVEALTALLGAGGD